MADVHPKVSHALFVTDVILLHSAIGGIKARVQLSNCPCLRPMARLNSESEGRSGRAGFDAGFEVEEDEVGHDVVRVFDVLHVV